jgi:hypothetical protein
MDTFMGYINNEIKSVPKDDVPNDMEKHYPYERKESI